MAEKKIDDTVYKVEPILATQAVRLLTRLTKAGGAAVERLPVIFAGANAEDGSPEAEKSNAAAIAAFSDLFMKNDTEDLVKLIADLIGVAKIQRASGQWDHVDFDGDMSERMHHIVPLGVFVIQEQFASFFGGALALGSLKAVTGRKG